MNACRARWSRDFDVNPHLSGFNLADLPCPIGIQILTAGYTSSEQGYASRITCATHAHGSFANEYVVQAVSQPPFAKGGTVQTESTPIGGFRLTAGLFRQKGIFAGILREIPYRPKPG
jgi:hypothetical protein